MRLLLATTLALFTAATALAQTPPPTTKQSPPAGVAIPDADRQELTTGVAALGREIETLRGTLKTNPALLALLPDVQVMHKAVDWALRYDEFMDAKQVGSAKRALAEGMERAKALRTGAAPWTTATGPQIRGCVSKIDGSVQPYGLVMPEDFKAGDKAPRPLLVWLAGRNDKRTELAFLDERWKSKGEFTPPKTLVLHPYGRFCNATKFAGETDVFEAMASVQARYTIDPLRIAVAGFSMGGASTWHMATHHAGSWCAMSPGAGFCETAKYAGVFGAGKEPPPWWEQMLYRQYDATDYVRNLFNNPLMAYSGEIDPQRASADTMEKVCGEEGVKMERLIGPQTAHKYEPGAKKDLSKWLDQKIAAGTPAMPPHVKFTTYTLRYNAMKWITLDALEKHWERADIDADLVDEGTFQVKTKNVAAFTIALGVAPAPLDKTRPPRVVIDRQELVGPPVKDYWTAHFRKGADGKWALTASADAGVTKHHGLTGPIDDAFVDSFIFVRPTGKPLNDKTGAWAKSEMERAIVEWRRVFRGDARVKDDTALTADDVANANLVLWGDPASNRVLKSILEKAALAKTVPQFPLSWTAESVQIGTAKYGAADHAPILVFPNPLNPKRYVVLNSGFTFREGSTTTNALQTPKLPDWAIVDLRTPPSLKWPGLVMDAGFFDEAWRWPGK
jgi:pimeloyl-ACP methyl ester carboxylesterase